MIDNKNVPKFGVFCLILDYSGALPFSKKCTIWLYVDHISTCINNDNSKISMIMIIVI